MLRSLARRIAWAVAIKVLLPEHSQNPEIVRRFFNGARAATRGREGPRDLWRSHGLTTDSVRSRAAQ